MAIAKTKQPLLLADSKPTIIEIPSPADMKSFAERFSKEEWDKLCLNQTFLSIFTNDLKACRVLAEKVLAGKKV